MNRSDERDTNKMMNESCRLTEPVTPGDKRKYEQVILRSYINYYIFHGK